MARPEACRPNQARRKTVVLCPWCGARTNVCLRYGDATVYCDKCKNETEVIIHAPGMEG